MRGFFVINFQKSEMEKTIETLESEYKIPFTMFVEGLKFNEIAEILQLNTETVKSRIFFVRKQLQAQLKNESKNTPQ